MFSAKNFVKTDDFQRKLKMFSLSDTDALLRETAIVRAIQNTQEITNSILQKRKAFSGASVSSANLDGSTIFAAIMRSYVNSFAPIFCVSRDMDTPKQQLMYTDFHDIFSGKEVVPNIGRDQDWVNRVYKDNANTAPIDTMVKKQPVTVGTGVSITTGTAILPRSFQMEVLDSTEKVIGTVFDDGNGKFLATPGILANTSAIEYSNGSSGTITINWDPATTGAFYSYSFAVDQTNDDKVNRAFGKNGYYNLSTEPILVPVERDVIADHAMAKQGIINTDDLYSNFIENEYTKAINNRIVRTLLHYWTGDTYLTDLSAFSVAAGHAESLSRTLKHVFTQGENLIAEQTYKEAKVTGILASHRAVDLLNFLTPEQGWVRNTNRGYYKDIVGWLDEAPVVLTDQFAKEEQNNEVTFLMTSRTQDGQIAPLFHGIFLAPTDLPVVANYAQLTQYTSGLYSMEGFGFTSSKLGAKLRVKVPENLWIKKQ